MKVRMLWIMVLVCQMESVAAQTGIWQWSVPVRYFCSHPKNPVARAYLWIPEQCRQVKPSWWRNTTWRRFPSWKTRLSDNVWRRWMEPRYGYVRRSTMVSTLRTGRGVRSLSLSAQSDSGLPVGFYVESGPAYVEGNQLIFTPIPPKATYPVEVTVVAWQYGRKQPTAIQTAEPVRRTFLMK